MKTHKLAFFIPTLVPVLVPFAVPSLAAEQLEIPDYVQRYNEVQAQSQKLSQQIDVLQSKAIASTTIQELQAISSQQNALQIQEDSLQQSLNLSPNEYFALLSQSFTHFREPCDVRAETTGQVTSIAIGDNTQINSSSVNSTSFTYSVWINPTTGGLSLNGSGDVALTPSIGKTSVPFSLILDLDPSGNPAALTLSIGSPAAPDAINETCTN